MFTTPEDIKTLQFVLFSAAKLDLCRTRKTADGCRVPVKSNHGKGKRKWCKAERTELIRRSAYFEVNWHVGSGIFE